MDYHGFRSVKEYENECARVGFTTRRVPFHKGSKKYFALIASPPKMTTSIESWTLFTADETAAVLDGVINGVDVNYLGKLAAHGYFLDEPVSAPAGAAPLPTEDTPAVNDEIEFYQFSLLSV